MSLGIGYDDPVIRSYALGANSKVVWGVVRKVDPESQTMNVDIPTDGLNTKLITNISINNMITNYGTGIRQMPIADKTIAVLYKDSEKDYIHIGYYLRQIKGITLDKAETKDNSPVSLLDRYLEEGELQISGFLGNEILMSLDGSVLIKNQFGAFIKLENLSSTLEGSFANLYYQMDGVRIRAGNIRRPALQDTTEEAYVVSVNNVATVEDQVQEGDVIEPLKEFMIKVGTYPDSTNKYLDDEDIGPKATFFFGDKLINQDGSEFKVGGKSFTCMLQTKTDAGYPGSGFAVTEEGHFHIMDWKSFNSTKFSTTTDEEPAQKVFRVGGSLIQLDADGLLFQHAKTSFFQINEDGWPRIQDPNGRYIELGAHGTIIDSPEGAITLNAKDITLVCSSFSVGAIPTDGLVKATGLATMYDVHTHAGPTGPPTALLTPLLFIPMGTLVAQGMKSV